MTPHTSSEDHYSLIKTYRFSRGEAVLAEEEIELGFYYESLYSKMFTEAGFETRGLSENGKFFILKKI